VRLIGLDVFSAGLLMPDAAAAPGRCDRRAAASSTTACTLRRPAAPLKSRRGVTVTRGDASWSTRIAGDLPAARPDDLLLVADIARVQAHFGPADGVSEVRIRLAPDTARRLAGGMEGQAAARPQPARRRRQPGARFPISRAPIASTSTCWRWSPCSPAASWSSPRSSPPWRSARPSSPCSACSASRRACASLQVLLEGLAIGVPGAVIGLALGWALAVAFTRLLGGDLGGGFFSGSTPVIVPEPAGAGLLRPGLRRQPLRRALPGLAQPHAAAGAGAEDRLRAAAA
jgi:putative ABC transport system permease protein